MRTRRDGWRRRLWLLALAPLMGMMGCLQTTDIQKAISSGLQATANGIINVVIRSVANTIVGLPPNPL